MTQIDQVRTHLALGKSITPMRAMTVYGISRLASCIEDLRHEGLEIDTVLKRDEVGKQYGEYRLREAINIDSVVQVKPGYGIGLPKWIRRLRGARVIAKVGDSSLVRFVYGKNLADYWLNDKEMVRA